MPYLQLDVTGTYPVEAKKALAQKMASTYADMMKVDIRRISIAIREVGNGGVWRIVDGEPVSAAVMMCDIRRGRTPELRMQVSKARSARDDAQILKRQACSVLQPHREGITPRQKKKSGAIRAPLLRATAAYRSPPNCCSVSSASRSTSLAGPFKYFLSSFSTWVCAARQCGSAFFNTRAPAGLSFASL
jgi:phenylpyruvate tautomerase PptA (4-oxalocrotonate tautomerase family)